jgi:hypothetical protein
MQYYRQLDVSILLFYHSSIQFSKSSQNLKSARQNNSPTSKTVCPVLICGRSSIFGNLPTRWRLVLPSISSLIQKGMSCAYVYIYIQRADFLFWNHLTGMFNAYWQYHKYALKAHQLRRSMRMDTALVIILIGCMFVRVETERKTCHIYEAVL